MNEETDRRRHTRLLRDDQLFIQILAASESPHIVGVTLHCFTRDVSSSGVKIEVDEEIPLHSELDLWVDVKACARKFFLSGLVKWCYEQNADASCYQLGIELLDMPFTDFKSWQKIFNGIERVSQIDINK